MWWYHLRLLLVFLVDRVFVLSSREKCNMEEDVSLTSCYCQLTAEARDISKKGEKPHVHCPCEKCNGRATWRMTAWRHLQLERKQSSQPSPAKKTRTTFEEFECSALELPVEYEDNEFQHERVLCFADTYSEFPIHSSSDVCVEAVPSGHDHDDISSNDYSSTGGSDSADDEESGTSDDGEENLKKFVQDSVLRLVEIKQKMGCSINHFEELLQWGKHLHTNGNDDAAIHWPKNWDDVQTLLKELGFSEPKQYWICFNKDHFSHYGMMESKDEPCPHCGHSGTIPYYYLGLPDKVKKWCSSAEMCKKMTAHWSQCDHWLPAEMKDGWGWPLKHEIWDGTRFANLAYFWDPNSIWTLPVRCTYPGCNTVISASEIINSPEAGGGLKRIKCSACGTIFEHFPKETHGDPRNIAYCGHWDGWQPFSSTVRGCGAIEVSIATMSKVHRSHTNEIYVVGFVPSYLIPKKRSQALDPFLEPLINDLEEGFINGIPVNYAATIAGIPSGPTHIRHLLLCWKGDHNGQCEAGKFIKCGKMGCRRCKLQGLFVPASNHYYYPGFREQGRFPTEEKSILESLEVLKDIEEEERITVKREKSKNTGYTGLSIFHRLYPLYQFLYDKDFVYDEMHGLPLNVVKRQIQCLLASDNEELNWEVVDERLSMFPWTPEHRTGRLPSGITKRFGYWKAEDFNHFAFPAMEVCLADMLQNDPETQEVICCLARIIEYLSNHARNGWSHADACTFHEMCVRYAVLVEEAYGAQSCVITLHNLLHFKDDITRFSSVDNYSCWTEERAVRRYILTSNNHKNIEITFALSEARREFLKLRESNDHAADGLNIHQADISKPSARSLQSAKKLFDISKGTVNHERLSEGILVGGVKSMDLSYSERQIISNVKGVPVDDVPVIGWCCRSLLKPKHSFEGLLYRVGEHVIFADPEKGDTVATLESVFSVRVNNVCTLFCKGKQFKYDEQAEIGLKQVCITDDTIMFEASLLSRKVILFARNGIDDEEEADLSEDKPFVVVDYMRRVFPVTEGTVVVPYYPVVHDMVDVKGHDGQIWKACVLSFNLTRFTVNAKFFVEDGTQPGQWVPERSPVQVIHFKSILGISKGYWQVAYSSWIDEEE